MRTNAEKIYNKIKKPDHLYGDPAIIMTRGFPSLLHNRFGFFLDYQIHY
jgi:hypothetical protein